MKHSGRKVKHMLLLFSVPVSSWLSKMKVFILQSHCLKALCGYFMHWCVFLVQ